MSYRKGRENFTLIELLIVIAIITIVQFFSLKSNIVLPVRTPVCPAGKPCIRASTTFICHHDAEIPVAEQFPSKERQSFQQKFPHFTVPVSDETIWFPHRTSSQ